MQRILFLLMFVFKMCITLADEFEVEQHPITLDFPNSIDTISALPQKFISDKNLEDTCIWNFSDFNTDTTETYFYLTPLSPADIVFTRNRQHSYYKIINDTLFRTGYETSQNKVCFANKEPVFALTMVGDSLQGNFNGKGEFGGVVTLSLHGTAKTKICATGRLLLPDYETDSVLMVTRHRIISETSQPGRNILEKSQYWIKPPSYFPIVENTLTQVIEQNDTLQYTQTYYYHQTSLTESNRISDSLTIDSIIASIDSIYTDASYLPNPVISQLIVSYRLTQSAEIGFSMFNSNGFLMYSTNNILQEAGCYSFQIDMSSYPTGGYVLYVNVNDLVLSTPILKQ